MMIHGQCSKNGHIPLPPYINRVANLMMPRGIKLFMRIPNIGSVAAPTAGLHFDENLLSTLEAGCVKDG